MKGLERKSGDTEICLMIIQLGKMMVFWDALGRGVMGESSIFGSMGKERIELSHSETH